VLFLGAAKASSLVHEGLLSGVVKSPMSFFDTHPTGRLVNRFSSDLGNVDTLLPFQLAGFCNNFSRIVLTFLAICYVVPIFIAALVPLLLFYFVVQKCYIRPSRQLKRLDGVSKSPIYSHFGESITGAASIRSYKVEERFIQVSKYVWPSATAT
jgi:ABC-type multidrug transport system fused ATPase/permease subunit